jgi:hypothetical protein
MLMAQGTLLAIAANMPVEMVLWAGHHAKKSMWPKQVPLARLIARVEVFM